MNFAPTGDPSMRRTTFPTVTNRKAPFSNPYRVVILAIAALLLPASLWTQEVEGRRSHVVKAGDTLWDLAGLYLNDPFLWPEIYRINTEIVEDPHWIYPGEVLRIPGVGEITVSEDQPLPDVQPSGPTIFSKVVGTRRPAEAASRARTAEDAPHTAVREGEYQAAPWIDRPGGPATYGKVVASSELAGIAQASDRLRLAPHDRVYVTLPRGSTPSNGAFYLTYELGPLLDEGQVVIPTGVVEVEKISDGDATLVRLVKQFEEVKIGHRLVPLERLNMGANVHPQPTTIGVRSKVLWITSTAVLPSIQHYVILPTSRRDGISVGDQFTLFRPRTRMEDRVTLPEQPIALLQVVRVTDRGTTGLVVDHEQPPIKAGMPVRMTAKMP